MEVFALIAVIAILGFLLWRQKSRHEEAEKAWRLERASLCARVQQPEMAATIDAPEPTPGRQHIPEWDDKAYAEYVEAVTSDKLEDEI